MKPPTVTDACERYWDDADWLPPGYILDRWCRQDERCWHAKQQALLSACERGEVEYRRRDGKTFDDPVDELAVRGLLLIGRDSFIAWAMRIEGKSPLASPPRPAPVPRRPAWADDSWQPPATPIASAPVPADASPPVGPAVDVGASVAPASDDAAETHARTAAVPPKRPDGDVSTDEIIAAFPVKDDEIVNTKWWKDRMREAKDTGLIDARTYAGRLREPSRWLPDVIAVWLVTKGHLPVKVVSRSVARHFPDWVDAVDYFLGD